jgi:hypothetical protein
LDTGAYEKGIAIPDKQMKELERHSIRRDTFHGEWNYTLLPNPPRHARHPRTNLAASPYGEGLLRGGGMSGRQVMRRRIYGCPGR